MNIHCAIIRFVLSSRFYFLLSLYLPNFLLLFYFLFLSTYFSSSIMDEKGCDFVRNCLGLAFVCHYI